MSTFGILLKTYRERAGLSQNELAVQAGLSASTISRVEGGTRNPLGKRRQVLALARALALQQSEIDALLSAADLSPSTAPELSLHPRDETLYRIAQELESLRNDRQIAPAQVRFIEETLLLVLRGARAALPAVDLSVVPSGAPAARALSEEERYLDDLLGDCIANPSPQRAMPFTVLAAVPLTIVGVIWGHLAMGIDLAMPSIMGFASLAGVIVNNSILLMEFIRIGRRRGQSAVDAARLASRLRFRSILLTSTTTIMGLLPLLLEKSLQAQILIPLVTALAFGLLAGTVLVLFVVPALYTIFDDFGLAREIETDDPVAASETGTA